MPTLQTVADTTETELVAAITSAWSVAKVHTSVPELETALSALPETLCLLVGVEPSDDDGGSLCSESASLIWHVLLHAKKPGSGSLAALKRERAQALRTEIKATDFTYASEALWMGEDYNEPDDIEVVATAQGYAIRLRFKTFVEWDD